MRWSLTGGRTAAVSGRARPLQWHATLALPGIEIPHLGRYLLVASVVAGCLMLSAWSRIDYRRTSLALDAAESAYADALAEQARLRLELAALRDPGRLAAASAALALDDRVPVVDLRSADTP